MSTGRRKGVVSKFVDKAEGEEPLAAGDATATTIGDDDFFEEEVIIID
jgi:hypothetical protein